MHKKLCQTKQEPGSFGKKTQKILIRLFVIKKGQNFEKNLQIKLFLENSFSL